MNACVGTYITSRLADRIPPRLTRAPPHLNSRSAMTHKLDEEVVYLTKRTGFVRMALRHNAPLVPVFAFGQTAAYTWSCPGPHEFPYIPEAWVTAFSRAVGFAPLSMHGVMYTPVPHQVPLCVVIGRPIPLPVSPSTQQAAATADAGSTTTHQLNPDSGSVTHHSTAAAATTGTAAAAAAAAADGLSDAEDEGTAETGLKQRRGVVAVASKGEACSVGSGWVEGDEETVQLYLKQYISALQALYEKHKADAGCKGMRLIVV